MNKRGQVTLFIILGVLIVVIVILLIFLRNIQISNQDRLSEGVDISSSKDEVENLITTCLEQETKDAIFNAGEHGGYALQDKDGSFFCVTKSAFGRNSLNAEGRWKLLVPDIEYVLFKDPNTGAPIITTPSHIKNCLANYISVTISACINNFASFTKKGWSMEPLEKNIFVRVDIGDPTSEDNKVFVELTTEKTFTKKGNSFSTDKYSYSYDVDFHFLREQAGMVANPPPGLTPTIQSNLNSKGYTGTVIDHHTNAPSYTHFNDIYVFRRDSDDFKFMFGL